MKKNSKEIDSNIFKFILIYKSISLCSTGFSPANLHLGNPLDLSFDRLTSFTKETLEKSGVGQQNCYRGGRFKECMVSDRIMCRII